jgi:S-layer homology domain
MVKSMTINGMIGNIGMRIIVTVVVFAIVGAACATGNSVDRGEVEICDDGVDNDLDGYLDCEDNDCWQTDACDVPDVESLCDDGVDNDDDGAVDCADADCAAYPVCQTASELCTDAMDNDGDSLVDCADPDCAAHTFCLSPETLCDDGQDNDNDGQADCNDADCNGDAACSAQQEICDDDTDNDGDGLIDCADPNCVTSPACHVPEDCDDGVDNDGDGLVDCYDADCASAPVCTGPTTETHCTDGLDDDGDGDVDCADPDCATTSPCDRCYDTFVDVPTSHWAYDFIRALYVNEVVTGCLASPLSYCPDGAQQRKYFAMMLIAAMGESPSTAALNAYFSDLTDVVSSPYVNRLFELGITSGCGGGQFCPESAVIRQDTAIFLVRALGETPSSAADDAYFTDLAGSYAIGFINRLYELNVTDGCGGTNYCPLDDTVRAASATFVARAFGYTDDFCGF